MTRDEDNPGIWLMRFRIWCHIDKVEFNIGIRKIQVTDSKRGIQQLLEIGIIIHGTGLLG
ncbi:hypothetical protein LHA01_10640 [Schleiferilactobacillus harbinensis]|nr:hypothetical protein LHA01_10640 [Schleiferilactobacillus harbinensis]